MLVWSSVFVNVFVTLLVGKSLRLNVRAEATISESASLLKHPSAKSCRERRKTFHPLVLYRFDLGLFQLTHGEGVGPLKPEGKLLFLYGGKESRS